MNIYKLFGGIFITGLFLVPGPYIAARYGWLAPFNDRATFILVVTAGGLVIKSVIGDFASGEFFFYKFAYDNCVMAFGAILTAFALQLSSRTDLFPGFGSVVLLRDIPQLSSDPVFARAMQLLVFLIIALMATVVTAAVAAAIKNKKAKAPDLLAGFNSLIGLTLLGVYVLLLVTKGN